jgi:hypothetical protein
MTWAELHALAGNVVAGSRMRGCGRVMGSREVVARNSVCLDNLSLARDLAAIQLDSGLPSWL